MFRINIQFFSIYLYIYWNDTLENYNPLFQFMGFFELRTRWSKRKLKQQQQEQYQQQKQTNKECTFNGIYIILSMDWYAIKAFIIFFFFLDSCLNVTVICGIIWLN